MSKRNTWLGDIFALLVIAFIAAILFAGEARGQQPISRLLDANGLLRTCGPVATPGAVPAPYPPPLPQQLGGKCTSIVVEANAKGGAVGWWCARMEPDPAAIHLYAVTWDKVTAPMLIDFARLGLPGDNSDLIRSMQSKYATLHVADMCDVWIGMRDRLNAIRPAPIPVPTPGEWKAYGGTIFKHANGKLTSAVTGKTATKGASCKGVTVATAGTFVFQELVGGVVGEATRCVKP